MPTMHCVLSRNVSRINYAIQAALVYLQAVGCVIDCVVIRTTVASNQSLIAHYRVYCEVHLELACTCCAYARHLCYICRLHVHSSRITQGRHSALLASGYLQACCDAALSMSITVSTPGGGVEYIMLSVPLLSPFSHNISNLL